MSLINDALNRAKQQTAQPAPAPHLPLRPVDALPVSRRSSTLLLAIIGFGVLGSAVVGLLMLKNVQAKKMEAKAAPVAEPVVQSKPSIPVDTEAPLKPETSRPVAVAEPASQPSNSVSMNAEVPALRPPPLKLQAILFSAANPSAMISGKTVYVGNRVGEFRVASITQTSATLVSDSVTNVLSFEE